MTEPVNPLDHAIATKVLGWILDPTMPPGYLAFADSQALKRSWSGYLARPLNSCGVCATCKCQESQPYRADCEEWFASSSGASTVFTPSTNIAHAMLALEARQAEIFMATLEWEGGVWRVSIDPLLEEDGHTSASNPSLSGAICEALLALVEQGSLKAGAA